MPQQETINKPPIALLPEESQQHEHHASRQLNSVSSPDSPKTKGRMLRQRIKKLNNSKNTVSTTIDLSSTSSLSSPASSSSSSVPSSPITTLPTKSFLPLTSRHQEKVGHIRKIQIGSFVIDVWYLAPYPEEYSRLEVLYVCEFCLKYMKSNYVAKRHKVSRIEIQICFCVDNFY